MFLGDVIELSAFARGRQTNCSLRRTNGRVAESVRHNRLFSAKRWDRRETPPQAIRRRFLWTRQRDAWPSPSRFALWGAMPLHLLKLCVGCDSIRDLEEWIEEQRRYASRRGVAHDQRHTTRMVPKRAAEIVGGGSLYWVIKGQIACRQKLLAIEPFVDGEGIGRCDLVLDQTVVPVSPRPFRPFQGWRYLEAKDAPPDLSFSGGGNGAMPEQMRRELAALGLL
jgi:hypothetical protein